MADDKRARVEKAHREERRQMERAVSEALARDGEAMPEDEAADIDVDVDAEVEVEVEVEAADEERSRSDASTDD
jgi:hypothetical protein